MHKKPVKLKAVLTAFLLALIITFFIGCFANPPANMDESFRREHWYYLNRGYPDPWAGVTLVNSGVQLPILRMPFLYMQDARGTELQKIVYLEGFINVFGVAFLWSYLPSLLVAYILDSHKKLLPYYIIGNVTLLAVVLFIYFFLFSEI